MQFRANAEKATDAVARLIQKSGKNADYLRLVKLIYLADRKSILERGMPIVGGKFYSMRKGPANGDIMDFVKCRNAPRWKELIAPLSGHSLSILSEPDCGSLSESEIQILDSVVDQHSDKTTEELVQWCHKNCPEYKHVMWGRKEIGVEAILSAEGKSAESIARIVSEGMALAELDHLLT
jgi:uncharacterized phage-associated protein